MGNLLNVISNSINWVIFFGGIILGVFIIVNASKLSNHKHRINDAVHRINKKVFIDEKTFEMTVQEEKENVTPELMLTYEAEFNKTCSWYNMYTQFIPIFPLLGILGTVAGLMSQVVAENVDALIASLNLALGSTLLGLLFSIILKMIVAISSARIIYDVETTLDYFFNNFDKTLAQNNISKE